MKLSLIIPAYNRAGFLEQTIQSGLGQTRLPDELMVIDDGSTDETSRVVEKFGSRVRYHYQENAGLAAARNTGLARSNGELLCFLDSDDLLLPRALEMLETALLANPEAALAYCRSQTIDAAGNLVEQLWPKEDHAGDVWPHLIDGNFIRSSGCALIRRSRVARVEPWDTKFRANEDWEMWIRLAEVAPFVRVDDPLFQYRVHGTNMSADTFGMHSETFRLLRKHLERNRNNRERFQYLRTALARAREAVARECAHSAVLARRSGEGRLAVVHSWRALRLRPRYLLEARFLSRMLRAILALGRGRSGHAWRTAP